jgi:hypothetical protein
VFYYLKNAQIICFIFKNQRRAEGPGLEAASGANTMQVGLPGLLRRSYAKAQ